MSNKICPNCGAENKEEAKFCKICATDIKNVEIAKEIELSENEKLCPNCKTVNNIEAKFCKNCAKSFYVESVIEQVAESDEPIEKIQPQVIEQESVSQEAVLSSKSKRKSIPLPLLICVIVVLVAAVVFAVYGKDITNNFTPKTTASTTGNENTELVTQAPTEAKTEAPTEAPTESKTTEQTTNKISLGAVSNSSLWIYDVWEEGNGGFLGVIIDFEPVDNADGYVLRYVYDALDSSRDELAQISRADTVLYFGTQVGPQRIDIRPYKEGESRDDIIYGEWYTIFNDQDIDYNSAEELDYSEWNSLTMTSKEIYP